MKKEDFDRLKALCQENDFELLNVDHEDNEKFYVIAKKKDLWDGVEFARYKFPNHLQFPFFKVKDTKGEYLIPENGGELFKGNCDPVTESAYVEQLKKQAFERFGEIKDGDRFDCSSMNKGTCPITFKQGECDWTYIKEDDRLRKGYFDLYEQGKWATRVKDRVEVNYGWTGGKIMGTETPICLFGNKDLSKSVFSGMNDNEIGEAFKFLASQLEAYLNLKDCETSNNGEIVSIHIKPKKGFDISKVEEKAQELASLCTE